MGSAGQDAVQLEVLEGQLTWLVHIIGAVISGRLSTTTAESQEIIDGDVTARAFGLLQIVDSGYAAQTSMLASVARNLQKILHLSDTLGSSLHMFATQKTLSMLTSCISSTRCMHMTESMYAACQLCMCQAALCRRCASCVFVCIKRNVRADIMQPGVTSCHDSAWTLL